MKELIATTLGLSKFPEHADTFVYSFLAFLGINQVVAPILSEVLFPKAYGSKSPREKNNWSIHVVSLVHVLIVVPLALRCLSIETLDEDRAFGWDERVGFIFAIACGYFLWDSLDSIVNYTDFGFVFHGVSCLGIYALSFQPFLGYYGVRFLLWEASTLFLNIHWFLDKTGRTGGAFQGANACVLLITFFLVRIVWGGFMSYDFFWTLYEVREKMSPFVLGVYGLGNLALQALNYMWFTKMIAAIRKRFAPASAGHTNGHAKTNGVAHANGNGAVPNGKHL